jgi:hypothetical protein
MNLPAAIIEQREALARVGNPAPEARLARAFYRALIPATFAGIAGTIAAVAALAMHGYELALPRTPVLALTTGLPIALLSLPVLTLVNLVSRRVWRIGLSLALAVPVTLVAPALGYAVLFREVDGGDAALFTRPWLHDLVWSTLAALYLFATPARAFVFPALPLVPLVIALAMARTRPD